MTMSRRRFAQPFLLALSTIAGLVASLAGEGVLKALGVLAVTLPLLAILFHLLRSTRPRGHRAATANHHKKENHD